jgi:predicted ester cyclase
LVVVQWVGIGTQTGPLHTPSGAALPATGQRATVPGTSILEIKDGKIVRNWVAFDMVTMLGQLGLLPAM